MSVRTVVPGDPYEYPCLPEVTAELQAFEHDLAVKADTFLGYPESMRFDYDPLLPLMRFNIDNLGDPYSDLLYAVNSTPLERWVLSWFTDLFRLDPGRAWGYVTSSGSEGNLYGLYLGREACPDAVLYYSAATHYSVPKAARLLRLPSEVVPADEDGEIDYAALESALRTHPGKPAVINANLGTTMTGAVDDVSRIVEILTHCGVGHSYIHCDAALSGMILPFLDGAPAIDFGQPIGSVSVSGHKFLGAPFPCGVVITRREHVRRITTEIPYIGAVDATIGGSRNGQAPLYLWYAIRTRGEDDGFRREVATCLANAHHLHQRLAELGWNSRLGAHSVTVTFDEPSEALVRRWSLARAGGRAHVVAVPHAARSMIDTFLAEISRDPGATTRRS